MIGGAKRADCFADVHKMSGNSGCENGVSASLALRDSLLVVAHLICEISARILIPDFVSGMIEPEWGRWQVRDNIVVVGNTLVAI